MSKEGERTLNRAFDVLEEETPDRVSRAIRWLRSPKSKWVRLPLAILFIAAALAGPILPVVGLELLPIGLLLLAQDVPFLKKPVGKAMLWLEGKWIAHKRKKQRTKGSTRSAHASVPNATRPTM